MFEDAKIPIQTWIFGTICMGTLELFFRSGDLFVWNEDGSRFWIAYYIGKYGNEIIHTKGVIVFRTVSDKNFNCFMLSKVLSSECSRGVFQGVYW